MRARLATGLVLLCLTATGCTGGASGEQSGPTLPPVTEAASPSPEAVPPEATEATPEGAAEFGRFFAMEVYRAYEDLDPERIERLSSPKCQACQRFVETIQAIRVQDAEIADTYSVEVLDATAPGLEPGESTTAVTVFLRIGEFVVVAPDGSELAREAPAEQAVQSVELEQTDDGWRVLEVTDD